MDNNRGFKYQIFDFTLSYSLASLNIHETIVPIMTIFSND